MKNILIINLSDTGKEAEALRQVLENMQYFVGMKNIGRPGHFAEVLGGKVPFDPDFIIISCHGENGKITMPVLSEEVYLKDELRNDFSYEEITRHLKFTGKIIINLGCTTGVRDMAAAFSQNNIYIAPWDCVEGKAAVFFTIKLFYELSSKGQDINAAYMSAKNTDEETELFCMYQNGIKK